jgi:coenzyme Q-binding protein COQ10
MPKHAETRILPYTAAQMYDLVADVASYPEFLPWCAAARIRSLNAKDGRTEMLADLVISFKVFRERFGSRVNLDPSEKHIATEYLDGPFRHMQSEWRFSDTDDGGCKVDFKTDFEFKNRILEKVIGVVFHEAMQRIVLAFEKRAGVLYGTTTSA